MTRLLYSALVAPRLPVLLTAVVLCALVSVTPSRSEVAGAATPAEATPAAEAATPAAAMSADPDPEDILSDTEANLPPLDWPRTFVGQPDFVFRREAVIAEYARRKGAEADKYVATMEDLVSERVINPLVPKPRVADLGRSKYSKQSFAEHLDKVGLGNRPVGEALPNLETGASIEVILEDGEKVVATLAENSKAKLDDERLVRVEVTPAGDIVQAGDRDTISSAFESLFAGGPGAANREGRDLEGLPDYDFANTQLPMLPSMEGSGRIDLSAFEGFLDNIIARSSRARTADLKDRDFGRELSRVTIQSIVTSPQKYAVINNKRYHVGDRFLLPVRMKLKEADGIEDIINTYIPPKDSVSEDIYKQYEELRDKALEKYRERVGITEGASDGVHKISVTVKDIQRRKVIVSVFDKEYPLQIRLAL